MAKVEKSRYIKTIALPFLSYRNKKLGKIMGHRLMLYGYIDMDSNVAGQEI